jgi:hypothetical protein
MGLWSITMAVIAQSCSDQLIQRINQEPFVFLE